MSSGGMSYLQPVQKQDPDVAVYETNNSMKEESEVCRLCTTSGSRCDMLPIFLHMPFAERVISVSNLQIFEGDGLPHHVCNECRIQVDSAFQFKTVCWNSDKALRQALIHAQPDESVLLEDIAHMDLLCSNELSTEDPIDHVGVSEMGQGCVPTSSQKKNGPRILSCTSLTKAEEALLLSGQLKSDNHLSLSPVMPKKKPPDDPQAFSNNYANHNLDPSLIRNSPPKIVPCLMEPTQEKEGKTNVEVRKNDSLQNRFLVEGGNPNSMPEKIYYNLNTTNVVMESISPISAPVNKDSNLSPVVSVGTGSFVWKEEGSLVQMAQSINGLESVTKIAKSGEMQRNTKETANQLKGTAPFAPDNYAEMDTLLCPKAKLPTSSQSNFTIDITAVESKTPLFVFVSMQEESHEGCSSQGSSQSTDSQGNYQGSCDISESFLDTTVSCQAGTDISLPPTVSKVKNVESSTNNDKQLEPLEETTSRKRGRPRRDGSKMFNRRNDEIEGSNRPVLKKSRVLKKTHSQEMVCCMRGRLRNEESTTFTDVVDGNNRLLAQDKIVEENLELNSSIRKKKLGVPVERKLWNCTDCNTDFYVKNDLRVHLTNHGNHAVMECTCCREVFCNLGHYNTHVQLHKSGELLAPTGRTNTEDLLSHKVSKTVSVEKRTWKCVDCQKEFNMKKDLTAHLTNHGTRSTMQCDYCSALYCNLARFNTHMRTHKGQPNKLCVCEVCNISFARATDLQRHCRIHWAGEAHICKLCGKALPLKAALEAHMKTEHNREKMFKCKVCNKPFTFLGSLKDHVRLKHPEDYVHQCDSCQETFESAQLLQQHITIHIGISCFTCDKCYKKFSIKEVYKNHLRNHDRARRYICETCGKGCLTSSALKCHQRIHTGDRPFKCHTCDKAYAHPNALRCHLMSHTNERSFGCSICGKFFRGKTTLRRHMVAHSNLREFKCAVCGLEFLYKNNLNRHLNKQHGRFVGTKDTQADDQVLSRS